MYSPMLCSTRPSAAGDARTRATPRAGAWRGRRRRGGRPRGSRPPRAADRRCTHRSRGTSTPPQSYEVLHMSVNTHVMLLHQGPFKHVL